MRYRLTILSMALSAIFGYVFPLEAQEPVETNLEEQLESLTESADQEPEDDAWLQQMAVFKMHPLNINKAEGEELRELGLLNEIQVTSLLSYRKLLGRLTSIYELQSVPAWNLTIIRKLLPYITIGETIPLADDLGRRFLNGDHLLLLRFSRTLEKSIGYSVAANGPVYSGSPEKIFFRYRYQFKNLLQYGVTGDKDAGEQFFKGARRSGFDFYSFHLLLGKKGWLQTLVLGDYTLNFGQGLIQWQGLAFGKGSDIAGIKRQSKPIKPYTSAGEYNFHRGAAITFRKAALELTAFVSKRLLSANLIFDSFGKPVYFSSFLTSGLNRSETELENRNRLKQFCWGGNLGWTKYNFHVGINAVAYRFSLPLKKRDEPYNRYAIKGDHWSNFSVDYGYTIQNFHFFGETALDQEHSTAFINGLIFSAASKVDLSLLYRNISKQYQSLYATAFTENSIVSNEEGIFLGCAIRPIQSFRIDAYADHYRFPWLKYLVDAPSAGLEYVIKLTYTPDKKTELYTRYRFQKKQGNDPDHPSALNPLTALPKQNWRTQFNFQLNRQLILRNRLELLWYDHKEKSEQTGFLAFSDIICKPFSKPWSGSFRIQLFESGGYQSRLYAYENDLQFSNSVPVFFDQGFRYYLNFKLDPGKKISLSLKWAQTLSKNREFLGSGNDEILKNHKSEAKLQILISL